MLTKLTIKNFKQFDEVEIDLASPVVFIGPNNSGKTSALQALALWELGLKRWIEKRGAGGVPGKRPGITINRRDFTAAPIPSANLLWRNLHTRDVQNNGQRPTTQNVRVELLVEGLSEGKNWACGFEFDYSNEESFYCRPLRVGEGDEQTRMPVPPETLDLKLAFLPPMSGLAEREFVKQAGQIAFQIGQGLTSEVLRNLCLQLYQTDRGKWNSLTGKLKDLFGVDIADPKLIAERAEITMSYRDVRGIELDLSCSGRGLQQTLLLFAYVLVNPRAVILLDEPDAHLEILRQREIYNAVSDMAREQQSQIIAASHSEVILNEAADKDVVIAFVGKPHRIDDRTGTQALKSLRDIGFEQYYQAEQMGWVLYLEGSTDLAILQAFAERLGHPAAAHLKRPFVHYVSNQPSKARSHFYGLREAKNDLQGLLICDRLDSPLNRGGALSENMWQKREIENYLCQPATLTRYASNLADENGTGPLFEASQKENLANAMQTAISDLVPPLALRDLAYQWWSETKVTDDFLDILFERFFASLEQDNIMRKTNYFRLAKFVSVEDIDLEIRDKLDEIVKIALAASPALIAN